MHVVGKMKKSVLKQQVQEMAMSEVPMQFFKTKPSAPTTAA
jgi:hypothetical protein